MSTRVPSRRERIVTWLVMYAIAITLTTLYYGGAGFLASCGFLALGFYAGWTYRNDRDH